jgi:radical SAM superfamily enzyme YgiQ (UPF0313 family)
MKIDLVFAPQHDPGFPHCALPHLKGFLNRNIKDIEVRCVDLNHQFYKHIIGNNYYEILNSFRSRMNAFKDISEAINIALDFENYSKEKFNEWSDKWKGYSITLRTLDSPFKRNNPKSILKFITNHSPFDDFFIKYLEESRADIIGINLSVEDQILPSFKLASLIRIKKPFVKIIWGGSLLSRIYPVFIKYFSKYFDYTIVREGEIPLTRLLNYLLDYSAFPINEKRIIASSETSSVEMVRNFNTEFNEVTDISLTGGQIFDDYDVNNYWNLTQMLPILSGRKCYWSKCKFCTIHQSWDNKKRFHNAKTIFNEVKRLSEGYGINNFRFVDEASFPKTLMDFSELIISSDLKINFEIYAIAEKCFEDINFVQKLGQSGCRQIYFGLESADIEVLKLMNKQINKMDSMSKIYYNCAAAGIHVYAFSLFGYPGSTKKSYQLTIDFIINEKNLHTAAIGSFVPVIGSPFALENASNLIHSGGVTEDFSFFIDSDGKQNEGRFMGNIEAEGALNKILNERQDLAITTLLNDETRFCLSSLFGADFAQQISGIINTNYNKESIIFDALRQRIKRGN